MIERFLGGSPAAVFLRLAVISLIAGIVLAALGLDAFDVYEGLKNLIRKIYDMGFEAFEWIFRYFLLGAVLVFPVWVFFRTIKFLMGNDKKET